MKINYTLVSMAAMLRDYGDPVYINETHEKLTNLADGLYHAGFTIEEYAQFLKDEYKPIFNEYGKDYFEKVIEDMAAIDTQLTHSNLDEFITDYNDRCKAA